MVRASHRSLEGFAFGSCQGFGIKSPGSYDERLQCSGAHETNDTLTCLGCLQPGCKVSEIPVLD